MSFKNLLAEAIEDKAQFRSQKAYEYAHDSRNKQSADGLQRLAAWVRTLPDDDASLVHIRDSVQGDEVIYWPVDEAGISLAERMLLRFDFNGPPSTPEGFGVFLADLAQTVAEEARAEEARLRSVSYVPTFFRNCVKRAQTGRGYSGPGYHLGIHARELAEDAEMAVEELDAILGPVQGLDIPRDIEAAMRWPALAGVLDKLWGWFSGVFPACMVLVPAARKRTFMTGVLWALEEGRL